jgi:hypothetical protein
VALEALSAAPRVFRVHNLLSGARRWLLMRRAVPGVGARDGPG